MRVSTIAARFLARRTRLRQWLVQCVRQFGQQGGLFTGIKGESPCVRIDKLQLPGQQGQAGRQCRQSMIVQVQLPAGWSEQLLQGRGVLGDFKQPQAAGAPGKSIEGVDEAMAGVGVIGDQFQVLQALLGLGQQHLRIQQKVLQSAAVES